MKKLSGWYILLCLLNLFSTQLFAADYFDKARPSDVDDKAWYGLKQSINETKFLPQPSGIGGNNISVGRSVSVDGNRALVGAPNMDTVGYVYVFEFDGSSWSQSAVIKPTIVDEKLYFGYSVSLSGDRALIGADSGVAYVFDYDGTDWVETQQLIASDRIGAGWIGFGRSVSLSGNRAVVGAEFDSTEEYRRNGSAYIFEYDGNTWVESQKLTADDADDFDLFSHAVGISGDSIFVGAEDADGSFNRGGVTYVFMHDGTSWVQTQKLEGSNNGNSTSFGKTLSISGNKAVIGAGSEFSYIFEFNGSQWLETKFFSNSNGDYDYTFIKSVSINGDQVVISGQNGATAISGASVFNYDMSWVKTQQIASSDTTENSSFGSSVSISANGLVIGSDFAVDTHGNHSGAAFLYGKNGQSWDEDLRFSISEDGSAAAYFGYSVSLSGNRALVGAYGDNDLGRYSGSAYIYDYDGETWTQTQKIHASDGEKSDNFAFTVSLLGNRAIIGAYGDDDNGESSGAAYVFDYDGAVWNQTQKLSASDGEAYDGFGRSVSLTENRIIIGADRNNNDDGRGAAYVFELDGNNWQEMQKLTALDSNEFGSAVYLSGNKAFISDVSDDQMDFNAGAVYVYYLDGNTWLQEQKILASDGERFNEFGYSLQVSGNTLVVGANRDDDLGSQSGSAYVFDFDGSVWNQTQKLMAPDGGEYHQFGESVSIVGNSVLVGASRAGESLMATGSAYLFKNQGNGWNLVRQIFPKNGSDLDYFGRSVSLGLNMLLIGSSGDNDHGKDSGSAIIIDLDLIFKNDFE